ncbi:MAG: P-II family nitrogen regulator [Phycisphaeraceae bacterium]|nr:P-II family nitrogen regulator [Phycisphaeraceae bacterium]
MKLVIAIIQPDRLNAVHQSLIDTEIFRISVSRVTGHGQQDDRDLYRGQEVAPDLIPKVRLEIAVNDDFVEPTIKAVVAGARNESGEIGDGKIFVLPMEDCIRIRTGERGPDAI